MNQPGSSGLQWGQAPQHPHSNYSHPPSHLFYPPNTFFKSQQALNSNASSGVTQETMRVKQLQGQHYGQQHSHRHRYNQDPQRVVVMDESHAQAQLSSCNAPSSTIYVASANATTLPAPPNVYPATTSTTIAFESVHLSFPVPPPSYDSSRSSATYSQAPLLPTTTYTGPVTCLPSAIYPPVDNNRVMTAPCSTSSTIASIAVTVAQPQLQTTSDRTVIFSDSPPIPETEKRKKRGEKSRENEQVVSAPIPAAETGKVVVKKPALICASQEPKTYASWEINGEIISINDKDCPAPRRVSLIDSDHIHEPGYTLAEFEYCAMPAQPAIPPGRFSDNYKLFKKIRNRVSHNLPRLKYCEPLKKIQDEEFGEIDKRYPAYRNKSFPSRPKIASPPPSNPMVYKNPNPASGSSIATTAATLTKTKFVSSLRTTISATVETAASTQLPAVISRNKMVLNRKRPAAPVSVPVPSKSSTSNTVQSKTTKVTSSRNKMSLRIINGQKVLGGSNACYAFLQGKCMAGIFCRFEHAGSTEHYNKKICFRLLRGRCRPSDACPNSHDLLPHQLPICEFFLALKCTHSNCPLLHVNYGVNAKPCELFQKGTCTKGSECDHPHRYIYQVIKERSITEDRKNFYSEELLQDAEEGASLSERRKRERAKMQRGGLKKEKKESGVGEREEVDEGHEQETEDDDGHSTFPFFE